jgi:hypothetical protein
MMRRVGNEIEKPGVDDPRFALAVGRERIGGGELTVLCDPLTGPQVPPDILIPIGARSDGDDEGAGAEGECTEDGDLERRDRSLQAYTLPLAIASALARNQS